MMDEIRTDSEKEDVDAAAGPQKAESLCDALRKGTEAARHKAREAAPKVKSTVAGAIHDLAYGAAFGTSFAGFFAGELLPRQIKDGLRKGVRVGRQTARGACRSVRSAMHPSPASAGDPADKVIDIGGEPSGS